MKWQNQKIQSHQTNGKHIYNQTAFYFNYYEHKQSRNFGIIDTSFN